MEIRWLADRSFIISTATGTLVTDPLAGSSPGSELDPGSVVATASHAAATRGIDEWREKTHVIDGPGEYEISGLGVRGIATSMADVNDPRALNTVFILDAELISVCHLGALAAPLTTQAAQLIGHVDVLITPAGGMDQAISADQAAAVTRVLEPRLIIPIHPGVLPGDPVYTSLAAYVAEVGLPMPEPVSRITVTRSNIGEVQRLVVLRPLGAESY
ncbi:MAG: MBL fold metallo-hydrolase [Chloroflexi bacterium]|nr:MBL fold metallo-hydrolase [Chloroflexota bacterium]